MTYQDDSKEIEWRMMNGISSAMEEYKSGGEESKKDKQQKFADSFLSITGKYLTEQDKLDEKARLDNIYKVKVTPSTLSFYIKELDTWFDIDSISSNVAEDRKGERIYDDERVYHIKSNEKTLDFMNALKSFSLLQDTTPKYYFPKVIVHSFADSDRFHIEIQYEGWRVAFITNGFKEVFV